MSPHGDHNDKNRRQGRPAKRLRDDLDKYWSDTIWQRTAQYIGDGMLRHSPNHGTLRLPNDDDDDDDDDDFPLGWHCIFVPNTSLKLR